MPLRRSITLFAVLAVLTGTTGASAVPPRLSADQQRRINAGEIVVLDALPPGASPSAQGGTAVAIVCAPPAAVWAILVDWPNHPTIYPRVTRAEVMHADSSRVRVRYTITIGPFSFDVDMDKYPDAARRRVEWRLAQDRRNRFFAESSGYWQVDEVRAGSLVTYAVATRTLLPDLLTRGSHRDSLASAIRALQKRATRSPCPSRFRE